MNGKHEGYRVSREGDLGLSDAARMLTIVCIQNPFRLYRGLIIPFLIKQSFKTVGEIWRGNWILKNKQTREPAAHGLYGESGGKYTRAHSRQNSYSAAKQFME